MALPLTHAAFCPICDKLMTRTHVVLRTLQDDLDVWECTDCGVSLSQTVKIEKLGDRPPGSLRSN
jgi:uncharacterized Zn finger protein